MPSKTTSRPRARAEESAASLRKQAHGTVDKEAQHWRRDTRSCSWAPRQLRARRTPRSTSDFSPHGAFGGFAEATAALVASSPTSTSGVGRLSDGGCSDRRRRVEAVGVEESASQSLSESDAATGGASEACARPAELPGTVPAGREELEAASGAREAPGRRS